MEPAYAQAFSYDSAAPRALIVAASSAIARPAAEALAACGCDVRGAVDFGEALADPARLNGIDLLLIEGADADADALDLALARADMAAQAGEMQVIAAVTPEQIDAAFAQLHGLRTQILCDPADADRVSAISIAKWRGGARLHDVSREAETVRLQRLNEEVARIADTLVKLTRGEDIAPSVQAPAHGYRGEVEAPVEITSAEIRATIRARRMRAQFFADELFGDPAWDMLLDLFAAGLERRQVSVSSLCIAAAVPPTTALRWIGTMHEAGLFERQADPSDRRRAYIALSGKGREAMLAYAGAAKRAGLPIA